VLDIGQYCPCRPTSITLQQEVRQAHSLRLEFLQVHQLARTGLRVYDSQAQKGSGDSWYRAVSWAKEKAMRIVVPIKQVPETSEVKMDEESGTMIRSGVESIVNPLDLYAIEQAILLKDQHGGTVTAISMGPRSAGEAIREAIAMGCDDGYLVSDRKFAGADTWATSYVLAHAIQKLGHVDLVICGERATDGDTGQVGPGIASFLDVAVLTYIAGLELVDDDTILVRRLVENGYEVYRAVLPVVLTVVKEIDYPRLPTLRGKQLAKRAGIPLWDNSVLGLDEQLLGLRGSPTRVKEIFHPKVSRSSEMWMIRSEEDLEAAADRVVGYLDAEGLLRGTCDARDMDVGRDRSGRNQSCLPRSPGPRSWPEVETGQDYAIQGSSRAAGGPAGQVRCAQPGSARRR